MTFMTFTATTNQGNPVSVEVYWDNQAGVEPGWCWRANKGDAGGDILEGVDQNEPEWALEQAKQAWGVA